MWECTSCTYHNQDSEASCAMCGHILEREQFTPVKSRKRDVKELSAAPAPVSLLPSASLPSAAPPLPPTSLAPAASSASAPASVAASAAAGPQPDEGEWVEAKSKRSGGKPKPKPAGGSPHVASSGPSHAGMSAAAAGAAGSVPPRAWGPAHSTGAAHQPAHQPVASSPHPLPAPSHAAGSHGSNNSAPPLLPSSPAVQPLMRPRRDPRLGANADEDERRATDEGRKVFVGNLKRPITRPEVVAHFEKFGSVERVILNSGFGLVLMTTREGAEAATQQRWQALDWRNVEVFLYEKGQKGASWTRPNGTPHSVGAPTCSNCQGPAAEHCAICPASLCLLSSCVVHCETCDRSCCLNEPFCAQNMLEKCESCQHRICPFCVLRPEGACAKCSAPVAPRLLERTSQLCEKFVKSHIGENDGAVYALVCALKGDLESSREGQLVAAIDRASKCFDHKASKVASEAVARAVKELDEAWESTRRVHNLRALRRAARQWSLDLSGQSENPPSHALAHLLQAPSAAPAGNPLSPLSHNDVQARDRLVLAIRAAEVFLQDFSSHPKADADRLSQGIRNALSGLRRSVRLADEFADRVELWGLLVRTHCGPGAPVTPGSVDRLKQAVLDAEHLYFGTKTFDEYAAHKERVLGELMRAARDLKMSALAGGAVASAHIKQAGRLARHLEIRVQQWRRLQQLRLPFNACFHHHVARYCRRQRNCPFVHGDRVDGSSDDMDGEDLDAIVAEVDEDDSFGASASSPLQASPRGSMLSLHTLSPTLTPNVWQESRPSPAATPTGQGGTTPRSVWDRPAAQQQQQPWEPQQQHRDGPPSHVLPGSATASFPAEWGRLGQMNTAAPVFQPANQTFYPSAQYLPQQQYAPAAQSQTGFHPPGLSNISSGAQQQQQQAFAGWDMFSGKKQQPPSPASQQQQQLHQQQPAGLSQAAYAGGLSVDINVFLQVSALCREAALDEYVTVISAAFQASGAAVLRHIHDVDVAVLHRELTKTNIPPIARIKVMNVINQRREQTPSVFVPALF